MTAVVDGTTAMKMPLIRRRPAVNPLGRWVLQMVAAADGLDSSSQQLLGRMFHIAWMVLDRWRASDTAQPVQQQLVLARLVSTMRQMSVALGRYYTSAPGRMTLALTADASVAFATLEQWDPTTTPTFDTDAVLLRVIAGVRFQ